MRIIAADNLGCVLTEPVTLPANGYVKIVLTDGRVLSVRENEDGGVVITASPGVEIKTALTNRKSMLHLDLVDRGE